MSHTADALRSNRPAAGGLKLTLHKLAALRQPLGLALWDDRFLIGITVLYLLSGFVTEWVLGTKGIVNIRLYSQNLQMMTCCYMVAFLCFHTLTIMRRPNPDESLYRQTWQELRAHYLYPRRFFGFAIVLLILPQFMGMFGSYKQGIPLIKPFCYDTLFMQWDYALHGGHHPWKLLQPVLGYPLVTWFINACYHAWLFIMFWMVIWQSWNTNRFARMQFLLSFMLMWIILGTMLAISLSSAGPCFYDRVTGEVGPYGGLLSYLDQANEQYPIMSINVREKLWAAYVTDGDEQVKGITAMPSMHVAVAVLLALAGWSRGRIYGICLTIFAVLIQLGSVHLAYHYAIDGYLSLVLVVILWKAVGWVLRRSGQFEGDVSATGRAETG